jgi:hypothetical protein
VLVKSCILAETCIECQLKAARVENKVRIQFSLQIGRCSERVLNEVHGRVFPTAADKGETLSTGQVPPGSLPLFMLADGRGEALQQHSIFEPRPFAAEMRLTLLLHHLQHLCVLLESVDATPHARYCGVA